MKHIIKLTKEYKEEILEVIGGACLFIDVALLWLLAYAVGCN